MRAAPVRTAPAPQRVVPMRRVVALPTLREFFESRPAVDPVLVARLRAAARRR